MKVFDTVPVKVPAKNVFNLSHDVKASYNFDKLYPFFCRPVYPGDTFNCRSEVFMRAMPMLAPVMHNVDLHMWFFFVPNRLIWNENKKRDFKTFITGGEDGLQNPVLPFATYNLVQASDPEYICDGSLLDHMGFPTIHRSQSAEQLQTGAVKFSTLPFRAYQLIYNEYFRNQNVQNEVEFSYDAGQEPDWSLDALFQFRKKCWEKDYFTSALPFLQRGEAVRLPIEIDASGSGTASFPTTITAARVVGADMAYGIATYGQSATNPDRTPLGFAQAGLDRNVPVQLEGQTVINGSQLVFAGLNVGTINDFRYCLRLQQWLENNARCGSRYIEQLFAHFGVKSSDARLQRPELLGGGKIPLLFTDVEQTSFGQGSSDNVLGDLGGKGTLYGKTNGFKKYFEEHGVLIGLLSIVPRTSYSQGIPREWTLFDKTDWYFPEFAHLGEQAVLNKEIYYNPIDSLPLDENLAPDGVFGYQGRFTELRYIPSSVHGEMRDTLSYWHFGRLFDSMPRLNSKFVTSSAAEDARVWALSDLSEQGLDPFVCQIHLDIKAVRPLPKYAVPTL